MLLKTKNSYIIALIASYIVRVDNTVDNIELKILYEFLDNHDGFDNDVSNILSGNTTIYPLEKLLKEFKEFPEEEKVEAYSFFLKIIYADGYYHDKEKEVCNLIRETLTTDDSTLSLIEKEVSSNVNKYDLKETKWKDDFLKNYYGFLAKLSLNKKNKFAQKHKVFLLGGPDFDKKIKDIANLAVADLDFSLKRVNSSNERLIQLIQELNLQSEKIGNAKKQDKELQNFIINIQNVIKDGANKSLEENLEVLNKKRRSIDYFSIAFLGRTKAGKSTLHSIITNDEHDDIGVGKLRTTRSNRTYIWENLRIIDTPGIGAPGGEADTEIAESIIDEVDLICYVVTNDAIQETEFKFMAELKAKNKPLIILLNVMEDIENPKRLNLFLKHPRKWLERQDRKNIHGHIDRINEYLKKYYGNCYYRVYPVMLLAAKMSSKDIYSQHKDVLYDASNINSFLTGVKEIVFDNGHLRKSQNIIDGCNNVLDKINTELYDQLVILEGIIQRLKSDLNDFKKFLKKERPKFKKRVQGIINISFNNISVFAKDFAINNYALNEKDIEAQWKKDIGRRGFIKDLDKAIKCELDIINDEIKSKIEEFAENFSLHVSNLNFKVKSSSTFNLRRTVAITSSLVGAIGSVLLSFGLVSNPIGWLIIVAGIAAGLCSSIFTSKQKKIDRAQKKIEESILSQLSEQKSILNRQVENVLNDMLKDYLSSVNKNYTFLIEGSESMYNLLNIECDNLQKSTYQLSKAMILRLFQQVRTLVFRPDLEELILKENRISKITRNFAQSRIIVNTKIKFSEEQLEKMRVLMQSDIDITTF